MTYTSTPLDGLISDFFADLQASRRCLPFVQKAEEAGYPNVAKMFRAISVSEAIRERLMRNGIVHHANDAFDYFICPFCGLIYLREAPEKCPVDDTPGVQFERIS